MTSSPNILLILCASSILFSASYGQDPINIWPGNAPGETTQKTGTLQPFRPNEKPPVSRVVDITRPTMTFHPAAKPNGTAVVILPGGGFGKVVPDKEGTEYAAILNKIGVSAFVLNYRTKSKSDANGWTKPLQDAQRALALVRHQAKKWKVDPNRVGLVGFSAGGNVATRLLCGPRQKSYQPVDTVDGISHRPDFAILVYPWNIFDAKADRLVDGLVVPKNSPPCFIVHTHDDRSTALGAVMFYAALKKHTIPAALHVYAKGGHGYGTRAVQGANIDDWTVASLQWLKSLK